jgi:hypothetical protein
MCSQVFFSVRPWPRPLKFNNPLLVLESLGISTHREVTMANMKAIVVEEYGDIMKLVAKRVLKPEKPQDHDILVR